MSRGATNGVALTIEELPVGMEKRFMAKVRKTSTCWLWEGAKSNGGYGTVGWRPRGTKQKNFTAHKVAYVLFVGPVAAGQIVRHTCGRHNCVKPAHLRHGPLEEAMQDALRRHPRWEERRSLARKVQRLRHLPPSEIVRRVGVDAAFVTDVLAGRIWPMGEKPLVYPGGPKKLSWQSVEEIRSATGVTQTALAKKYGVSQVTISDIVHRRTWNTPEVD